MIMAFSFILTTACNDIDRWPTPCPGKTLFLPIMGVVMKVTASLTSVRLSDSFKSSIISLHVSLFIAAHTDMLRQAGHLTARTVHIGKLEKASGSLYTIRYYILTSLFPDAEWKSGISRPSYSPWSRSVQVNPNSKKVVGTIPSWRGPSSFCAVCMYCLCVFTPGALGRTKLSTNESGMHLRHD